MPDPTPSNINTYITYTFTRRQLWNALRMYLAHHGVELDPSAPAYWEKINRHEPGGDVEALKLMVHQRRIRDA